MLDGKTVLVVETEFLIALDIQRMLESVNARKSIIASRFLDADALAHEWPLINLAIVEMDYGNRDHHGLATRLREAGIALVFSTADTQLRQGHPDFPDTPVIVKPMAEEDLFSAIGRALSDRS